MSPDTYSQAEMIRWLQRNEAAVRESAATTDAAILALREELRDLHGWFVPRELYDANERAWGEWKREVAQDVVNLGAEQARIRKDLREELAAFRTSTRQVVTVSVAVAGVVLAGVSWVTNALGLGA